MAYAVGMHFDLVAELNTPRPTLKHCLMLMLLFMSPMTPAGQPEEVALQGNFLNGSGTPYRAFLEYPVAASRWTTPEGPSNYIFMEHPVVLNRGSAPEDFIRDNEASTSTTSSTRYRTKNNSPNIVPPNPSVNEADSSPWTFRNFLVLEYPSWSPRAYPRTSTTSIQTLNKMLNDKWSEFLNLINKYMFMPNNLYEWYTIGAASIVHHNRIHAYYSRSDSYRRTRMKESRRARLRAREHNKQVRSDFFRKRRQRYEDTLRRIREYNKEIRKEEEQTRDAERALNQTLNELKRSRNLLARNRASIGKAWATYIYGGDTIPFKAPPPSTFGNNFEEPLIRTAGAAAEARGAANPDDHDDDNDVYGKQGESWLEGQGGSRGIAAAAPDPHRAGKRATNRPPLGATTYSWQ